MFSFARPLMAVAAAAVVAAFASLAGGALRADVLTLANGDRLKGKLVSNTDGLITFNSDALGTITIPAASASVTLDPPPSTTPAPATAPVPAKPKRKPKPTSFTPLDFRAVTRSPDKATKAEDTGWFNRIDFGLISQSGRTSGLNVDVRTENDRRTPLTETRFLNRYTYGKTQGIRSADAISSNLRFRRALSGRIFLQSSTRYDRNVITLTQCDTEQGFGLGMNLKATKTLVIAAGSDAAVRYRSYLPASATTPAAPHDWSCVLDVFQDMTLDISQYVSFAQDFRAVVAPTNDNDYKFNFNAGLTGKLTDSLRVNARVELEYDRTLLPDLRYNQRITTSLGYVF